MKSSIPMIRNIRHRRDQRQLEEEEEIWFNEDDDFSDVPTSKPESETGLGKGIGFEQECFFSFCFFFCNAKKRKSCQL